MQSFFQEIMMVSWKDHNALKWVLSRPEISVHTKDVRKYIATELNKPIAAG